MGKAPRSQTTTQTTQLDPGMQAYRDRVFQAAQAAGETPGAGIAPWTTQAADLFGGYAGSGAAGARALAGDPSAAAGFFNPFTSTVLSDLQSRFATTSRQVDNGINDAATRAGAFGGARHGVAAGVAQANLARDTNSQLAGISMQGFNDAMGRAGTAANLGLGAGSQLAGLGEYARSVAESNNPAARRLSFLQAGMAGAPSGQSASTTQPVYQNRGAGALGGATTGAQLGSMFGPWGTAIGGGVGGLFGLFG